MPRKDCGRSSDEHSGLPELLHSGAFLHCAPHAQLEDSGCPEEAEAEITKVEEPGGGTHYELRGVPESGKARLEALFQVGRLRYHVHFQTCNGRMIEMRADELLLLVLVSGFRELYCRHL